MSRLAENNRVLYVESVGLRTPTLAPHDRARLARRLKHYFAGPRRVIPNLYVFSPLLVPYYAQRRVREINNRLLRREVQRAARRLGMRRPILWSYVPNAYALVGHLDEQLVVYHCVDDLASITGVPSRAVAEMEEHFLGMADAVLTTSKALYEARKGKNPHTFYFSNVADAEHFGKALKPETPVAPAVAALPRPVAGYVGALDAYKVDFPFLAEVARLLPDWSFALVGPVGQGQPSTDLGDLAGLPNVHLLGAVPYREVPAYLKGMDVALIPHRLSDYTTASFPMKLYEYLAAGRPVVATPLPAIRDISLVRFADTPAAFAAAVRAARAADNPEAVQARVEEAKSHTWEERIRSFDQVLSQLVANTAVRCDK
ncbi:MAG: glycosyltransferase [Firmicutes bacterium]|nr:glycosyltransferase [Bacillota bacterium]